MAAKKMSKRDMDDHDDAHFSGNPAFRQKRVKRGRKKSVGRKSSKR